MSDHFVSHRIKFASAEPLQSNETNIHVLEKDGDRAGNVAERFESINGDTIEHTIARQELNEEIRKDPAYKFLLQVSAFSQRPMNKLTGDIYTPATIAPKCTITANVCQTVPENERMQLPEISGVIHLSAETYGHIKEAEGIANHPQSLKTLVENPKYQTLFARLVALRMGLSSTLAHSDFQKDQTFRRLHQEQTMVLRALQKIRPVNRRKWTEPYY